MRATLEGGLSEPFLFAAAFSCARDHPGQTRHVTTRRSQIRRLIRILICSDMGTLWQSTLASLLGVLMQGKAGLFKKLTGLTKRRVLPNRLFARNLEFPLELVELRPGPPVLLKRRDHVRQLMSGLGVLFKVLGIRSRDRPGRVRLGVVICARWCVG